MGDELITVFATHKSDFRDCGTARHNPFMPSNKHGNTSCFRIINLQASDIWNIATNHVLNDKIKNVYGRFDFVSQIVYGQRLTFDPNNEPERHANIIDWPSDKTAQKSKAQQIAAESIFSCEVKCHNYVAQVSYNKDKKSLVGRLFIEGKEAVFESNSVNKLPHLLQQVIKGVGVTGVPLR